MPKRIYLELQDSLVLATVAKKTGISPDLLKKAAAGRAELSASDLKKVTAAVNEARSRG